MFITTIFYYPHASSTFPPSLLLFINLYAFPFLHLRLSTYSTTLFHFLGLSSHYALLLPPACLLATQSTPASSSLPLMCLGACGFLRFIALNGALPSRIHVMVLRFTSRNNVQWGRAGRGVEASGVKLRLVHTLENGHSHFIELG